MPHTASMSLVNENWCVIIPMANEEQEFHPLVSKLTRTLDRLRSGKVYMVVDTVSVDDTRRLCEKASHADDRFRTVWAPENRNVVDAYMRGYKAALENGHDQIIEMDAGLSHDPDALPMFLEALNGGYECVFGSRFISGGSMVESNFRRRFLSRAGSVMANVFLGTKLRDMTSGYQGFGREIVERFVGLDLKSTGHFYQTELRFLLKKTRYVEIPIHYKAPSPNVNVNSILNSLKCLIFYTFMRLFRRVQYL
jgi:dolichol-phosphate mannosyltransferase